MKHLKVDAKTRVLIEKAIAAHSDGHDIKSRNYWLNSMKMGSKV